jgi:hypothetical protein
MPSHSASNDTLQHNLFFHTFQQIPQLSEVQLVIFREGIDNRIELGKLDAQFVGLSAHDVLLHHDTGGLFRLR